MNPTDTHLVTIEVLYFARLREAFGREREQMALPATVTSVGDLTAWLRARGDAWARELAPGRAFRVAVNQDMAEAGTPVENGDEVAFFPPVTGG
jgi:molybdopterin synthase sulfur carrier subunit